MRPIPTRSMNCRFLYILAVVTLASFIVGWPLLFGYVEYSSRRFRIQVANGAITFSEGTDERSRHNPEGWRCFWLERPPFWPSFGGMPRVRTDYHLRRTYYSLPLWLVPLGFILGHLILCRLKRPRDAQFACSRCGYNLTGNASGHCSECGLAIPSFVRRRIAAHRKEIASEQHR